MIQEIDPPAEEEVDTAEPSMADDPAWADVRPLDLSDPPRPVVSIQYDEPERQRLAYLYALIGAQEVSDRALRLTAQVIIDNSANYTAWGWRWACLRAGRGAKRPELAFLRACTLDGAKNYQLWNHRRRVALELGPPDFAEELRFTGDCLKVEPKNYHVWAHRQAVLLAAHSAAAPARGDSAAAQPAAAAAAAGMWAAELELCRLHIQEDVRNNSAWAQRSFVLRHCPSLFTGNSSGGSGGGSGGGRPTYDGVANSEVSYVAAQLRRAADNGSAWNYLRGLLTLPGGEAAWVYDDRLPQLCSQILEEEPSCSGALATLADVCAARARAAAQQQDGGTAAAAAANAAALWGELVAADPVRQRFWRSSLAQLQSEMAGQ